MVELFCKAWVCSSTRECAWLFVHKGEGEWENVHDRFLKHVLENPYCTVFISGNSLQRSSVKVLENEQTFFPDHIAFFYFSGCEIMSLCRRNVCFLFSGVVTPWRVTSQVVPDVSQESSCIIEFAISTALLCSFRPRSISSPSE